MTKEQDLHEIAKELSPHDKFVLNAAICLLGTISPFYLRRVAGAIGKTLISKLEVTYKKH
jgi:hypothetical protein